MSLNKITSVGGGLDKGIELRGIPVHLPIPGNVYWVGSSITEGASPADLGTHGKNRLRPFATLDYAIGQCIGNRGDVIYVLPGHAESLIADSGVDIDVAGITIIGLGTGEKRPIFTFTTDVDADFKIAAANVAIANLVFKCNIASQAMMIEVTGKDAEISNCEFREGTQTGLNFITVGVADNDSDRCHIHDCLFYMPTAGNGDSAIQVAKDHIGVRIERNKIHGNFDNASIEIPAGGNAQVDCLIKDCVVNNTLSGVHAIEINGTGSTGKIINCYVETDALATSIDAGGLEMYNCYFNDGTDQGGWSPIVVAPDSVTNILGSDDNDNGFASTNVAANEDGSILERLEQIQEAVNIGTGTSLAANKSLVDALGTDGTTVSDTATGIAGMLGVNDNDNAMDTTNVAANEDGSVFERLEQIQEAVNKGSGTAMAANKSIADALGSDGNAVTDSAVSVLGAIGANNNNNAFSSSSVIADRDGSVLERLEDLIASVPRVVSKAYADLTGYDTANAFTVTGDVLCRVFGVVGAVAITSTSGTTTLSVGTTESAAGIIAATTIDNSDFAATDVWVDNDPANDVEGIPANGGWVVIGGGAAIVLTRNVDDITGGVLTLYCEWKPLSSNGNVVAA